jgi:hypothetical protein
MHESDDLAAVSEDDYRRKEDTSLFVPSVLLPAGRRDEKSKKHHNVVHLIISPATSQQRQHEIETGHPQAAQAASAPAKANSTTSVPRQFFSAHFYRHSTAVHHLPIAK